LFPAYPDASASRICREYRRNNHRSGCHPQDPVGFAAREAILRSRAQLACAIDDGGVPALFMRSTEALCRRERDARFFRSALKGLIPARFALMRWSWSALMRSFAGAGFVCAAARGYLQERNRPGHVKTPDAGLARRVSQYRLPILSHCSLPISNHVRRLQPFPLMLVRDWPRFGACWWHEL